MSAGACSRPKDAVNPAAPVATPAAPLYSYAQTNDLRVAPQLTKGWYAIEDGAWRWMGKESQTTLKNPQTFPAQFEVRLALPKRTMANVAGPLTFTLLLSHQTLVDKLY